MKRSEGPKRFEEVAVSIRPSRIRSSHMAQQRSAPRIRQYDAALYGHAPELGGEIAVRDYPAQLGGLPLAAVETIRLDWARFQEYHAWFLDSEKSPEEMHHRLLEALSPRLQQIVSGGWSGRPVRIWWHLGAAELEELPWELLPRHPRARVSFARGLPGDLAPLAPLHGDLRLALIGDDSGLDPLWQAPPSGLTVARMTGPLREGLRRACAEGFQLVHVAASGSVSLGLDSILRVGHDEIAPPELYALLTGAGVAILAVSPTRAAQQSPALTQSTFRAFAHLGGGGDTSNTTLLAPIARMSGQRELAFWTELYAVLVHKLSIEDALWAANRELSQPTPVALFLHHRLGAEFTRRAPGGLESSAGVDPPRLDAELRASREFLDRIAHLQASGDEASVSAQSIADSRQSVEDLDEKLDTYRDLDGSGE